MDLTELKTLSFDNKSRHPWERARMRIIVRMLRSMLKNERKTKPIIFDVGCGDVFLSNYIAASFPGCEIHAVDSAFTRERTQEIKELTGNNSISLYTRIENITLLPERKTDIVLLLDVIEHIEKDTDFLSSLAKNKHISKDTIFIITAPAYQCLFSSHDKFLKHYRRYSRKNLTEVLNKSNLKSLKSGYFFFVLLFPRFIQLLSERSHLIKPTIKGIGQWNQGVLISWIFTTALIFDYFICSIFSVAEIIIPGLSVYTICRPAR